MEAIELISHFPGATVHYSLCQRCGGKAVEWDSEEGAWCREHLMVGKTDNDVEEREKERKMEAIAKVGYMPKRRVRMPKR